MNSLDKNVELESGSIITVKLTVNSGEQEEQFFGYIRKIEKNADPSVDFDMIVSQQYVNILRPYAKVQIVAHCKGSMINSLIDVYGDVCIAEQSSLLQGIVVPTLLPPIGRCVSSFLYALSTSHFFRRFQFKIKFNTQHSYDFSFILVYGIDFSFTEFLY